VEICFSFTRYNWYAVSFLYSFIVTICYSFSKLEEDPRDGEKRERKGRKDDGRKTLEKLAEAQQKNDFAQIAALEKALSLRSLAQKGDALALDIFDFQARALGLHLANLAMAVDAEFVVIGGGLIDPGSTTPEFRARYLRLIREAAEPYLWPAQRKRIHIVPATLGELSQAIGAALVSLFNVDLTLTTCSIGTLTAAGWLFATGIWSLTTETSTTSPSPERTP